MSYYLQGREARRNSLSRACNPFPLGTLGYTQWDEGWCDSDKMLRALDQTGVIR
jgi:hypothetical protein